VEVRGVDDGVGEEGEEEGDGGDKETKKGALIDEGRGR
jgi:hypothetical protein